MDVLQVSHADLAGGAGRAAYRLHVGLRKIAVESRMLVRQRSSREPHVTEFEADPRLWVRGRRWLRRRCADLALRRYPARAEDDTFSGPESPLGAEVPDAIGTGSEVVNLHWVSGFLDAKQFFTTLPASTPVVWTLHDMNAFTGGCHYDHGCGRFTDTCGACPILGSTAEHDLSRRNWRRRHEAYSAFNGRLHVVAPSRWLAAEAAASSLFGNLPVSVIPYGLDTDDFAPRDRTAARTTLGIPLEAEVVLFIAEYVNSRRKGMHCLLEALRQVRRPDLFLLSLGRGQPPLDTDTKGLHLGSVSNERLLSMIYSAADLFVIPSLEDNLPNCVLEAMACGVPTLGFAAGGIRDMVRPGQTGALARTEDPADLAAQLLRLLDAPDALVRMGHQAREVAVAEYALELQAKRYLELYGSLTKDRRPPAPASDEDAARAAPSGRRTP